MRLIVMGVLATSLAIAGCNRTDTAAPAAMVDVFHRWREETRKIAFMTLDPAKSVTVPAPDDAKLLAYYEANKRRFVTPEQRKLAVLLMTRDDVKKKVIVSDDEAESGPLQAVALELLTDHLSHCVADALTAGPPQP